ncbi:MAG: hypothetical protein EAZ13_00060 [Sphingobacteriia bacterium]|jgi:uncharacterized membrane protein|nr:MAG: hypothetical protein EAZ35_04175 [Sphingobacteriia bacterium]TAH09502.1 MAG: hypothetical protein EAZ13_00060 [Sphingobacteriia bacterium]
MNKIFKGIYGFTGFGLAQLLLFIQTINILLASPKENTTKNIFLVVIAFIWLLAFFFSVYLVIKAYSKKKKKI